MIDVHCHILPGLDDGARKMEESVAMARTLVEAGYEAVIATPHVMDRDEYRNSRDKIAAGAQALGDELQAAGVPLKVYPGAEYQLDRAVPALARYYFPPATMAGSLYILVELPMMHWPVYLDYSVWPDPNDPLEVRKLLPFLRPIIAHPERNEEVIRDYRKLQPLRDQGYFFQVNLESILGWAGKQTVKTIKQMAKEGLIDLVGSDGHTEHGLIKLLAGWKKQAEKVLGPELVQLAMAENPKRILNNEPLELEP